LRGCERGAWRKSAPAPITNAVLGADLFHPPGTTTFTVASGGRYLVDYGVFTLGGAGASFAIAVNGVVMPLSRVMVLEQSGNYSGTTTLELAAGDMLTLRNASMVTASLPFSPNVGAQLTIQRVA
jgi:hypothetical protein